MTIFLLAGTFLGKETAALPHGEDGIGSMAQWYYLIESDSAPDGYQRNGPISEFEVIEHLRNGLIPSDTLVWHEGMADWAPASDVPELGITTQPPPLPAGTGEIPEGMPDVYDPGVPQARPWVRYWARMMDFFVFSILVGAVIGFIYPAAMEINDTIFGMILLAVYVFVEPLMLASWGTTPGKALLRVRLRRSDGKKLSYNDGLVRSLKVWIKGYGLGIPVVSLITLITAYHKLTENGITSWDSEGDFIVRHKRIGVLRGTVAVLIFVFFSLLIAGSTAMQQGAL